MSEPTIAARMAGRLVTLLDRHGHDGRALAGAVGIDLRALADPQGRIERDLVDALVERAQASLGDGLGVALAGVRDAETYDVAGMLFLASPTLREAFTRSFRYQRLWGDGERFRLRALADGLAISFACPGPPRPAHDALAMCALVEIVAGARFLLDEAIVPRHASFAFPRPSEATVQALTAALGLPPIFAAPANAIELASTFVDRPLTRANELFAALFDAQAQRSVARLPPPTTDVVERVRAIVRRDLSTGDLTLARVAKRLRTPPRTLQRKLLTHGTTFVKLLDEERRALVDRLLARGTPIGEAAYLAGFHDPSALRRALVRWGDQRLGQ